MNCRLCHHKVRVMQVLKGMPAQAQYLPTKEDLPHDAGIDLVIAQCDACGLVQLTNNPVPYHREVIRAAGISPEMQAFRYEQFKGFIEARRLQGKSIIEIGCGNGEYLSIMSRLNVNACGVEYNSDAVTQCVSRGLMAFQGYVEEPILLPGGPFDAFYTLSFLEHAPDISSFLQGIRSHLTDEAEGIVEVPNFNMIKKNGMISEFMVDHLSYFTMGTLSRALQMNGFEIIRMKPVWYDYIISAVVAVRKGMQFDASFGNVQTAARLRKHVEQFGEKRVAVWGAGHQSLATLALSDISFWVRYVVDSAPFKQGRYTPATHLPIVAPQTLVEDPVDAIVIMAGSYSNEVQGWIHQHLGDINTFTV